MVTAGHREQRIAKEQVSGWHEHAGIEMKPERQARNEVRNGLNERHGLQLRRKCVDVGREADSGYLALCPCT